MSISATSILGFLCLVACHTYSVMADETRTVTRTIYLPSTTGQTTSAWVAQATTSPTNAASTIDTDAGAAGSTPSSIGLNKGGIIVVSVVVALSQN